MADNKQKPENVENRDNKLKQVSEKRLKRAESVVSMKEVLEELKEATESQGQKTANALREMTKRDGLGKTNTPKEVKQIAQNINSLIDVIEKGDQKELEQSELQIDALRQQAELITNEKQREGFLNQINAVGQQIQAQTGMVQKSFNFIKDYSDNILGLVTFMVSDSPLLAFLTMEAVKKFKEGQERKAEAKAAFNEHTRERLKSLEPVVKEQEKLLAENQEINRKLDEARELEEAKMAGDEEARREAMRMKDEPIAITINGEEVEEESNGLFDGLKNALGRMGAGLIGMFGGLFKFIGKLLFNKVTKFLAKAAIVAMVVGGLVNGFMEFTKTLEEGGTVSEALMNGLAGFFEFLSFGLLSKEKFLELTNTIGSKIGEMIFNLVQSMSGIFKTVEDFWDKSVDKISKAASGAITWITDKLEEIWTSIKNIFTDAIKNFLETPAIKAVIGFAESTSGLIDDTVDNAKDAGNSFMRFLGFGDDEEQTAEIVTSPELQERERATNRLEGTREEVRKIEDDIRLKENISDVPSAGSISQTNIQKVDQNNFMSKPSARNDDMSLVGVN